MFTDDTYQELSRQSLVEQAVAINDTGRKHLRAVTATERADAARRRFHESHGPSGRIPLMKIIAYVTFAIAMICIYWIDVLLFGALAEYVASLIGGGNKFWASLAKFVVPACFLGIEVLIALQIEKSRQEARFAFGRRIVRTGWLALGLLVALVMPLAAAATAKSASILEESDLPVMMIAVLAIVSFAAHVLVLFGGRLAEESKTYLAFASLSISYGARAWFSERSAARSLALFNAMFIAYAHALRNHNSQFTPVPSGPFDGGVATLLRQQFPDVVAVAGDAAFPREAEVA
jgi:hypothetical protein